MDRHLVRDHSFQQSRMTNLGEPTSARDVTVDLETVPTTKVARYVQLSSLEESFFFVVVKVNGGD